jgi:Mrp family chromosome partitioning ATPase
MAEAEEKKPEKEKKSRRKKKKKQGRGVELPPLQLPAADETLLHTIPGEVVRSLRHMTTKFRRADEFPRRIAVTSAIREEGVTFISLALAMILANDLRKQVCLVELNWWWPGLQKMLGDVETAGVAGILRAETAVPDALVKTGWPDLDLLPAGEMGVEERPLQARAAALPQLLDQLSADYEHVILDIPAVLATSDAIPLATLGEGCLLVVRQGDHPHGGCKAGAR